MAYPPQAQRLICRKLYYAPSQGRLARYYFITGLLTLLGLDKHRFRLYYES